MPSSGTTPGGRASATRSRPSKASSGASAPSGSLARMGASSKTNPYRLPPGATEGARVKSRGDTLLTIERPALRGRSSLGPLWFAAATAVASALAPLSIRASDDLEQVAIRILEVGAAPSEVVVDLTLLLHPRICEVRECS